ncbi:MAG: 50S ribosomal protein L21 [Gemmatimonadota bacterium]
MYAIIETGGRQFRAEPGRTLRLPSLEAEVGEEVTFDRVLLARGEDDEVKVGAPTVEGAEVAGEVVRHGKGEKIIVFKWKRRKNYRRKQGHRQKFTEVRIDEIRLG